MRIYFLLAIASTTMVGCGPAVRLAYMTPVELRQAPDDQLCRAAKNLVWRTDDILHEVERRKVDCGPLDPHQDPGPFPQDYEEIVKASLRYTLKDPYSVMDLTITKPKQEVCWMGLLGGANQACWESSVTYNAKNSFGAYIGLRSYTYMFKNGRILDVRAR